MQEQSKAYKALYETAKQHRELIEDNHFRSIEEKVQELELSVEFNMKLEETGHYWYEKHIGYGQCANIGLYSEEQRRQISWSDDKRQPEGEWLCSIRFSSGAYMFSNYPASDFYPEETFDAFFAELKAFGTAYCDTNNHVLYFTKDVAYKVCEAFPEIYKKYKALVVEEQQRQRVKELELELAKLKGN